MNISIDEATASRIARQGNRRGRKVPAMYADDLFQAALKHAEDMSEAEIEAELAAWESGRSYETAKTSPQPAPKAVESPVNAAKPLAAVIPLPDSGKAVTSLPEPQSAPVLFDGDKELAAFNAARGR
jgi:hypothetical protein